MLTCEYGKWPRSSWREGRQQKQSRGNWNQREVEGLLKAEWCSRRVVGIWHTHDLRDLVKPTKKPTQQFTTLQKLYFIQLLLTTDLIQPILFYNSCLMQLSGHGNNFMEQRRHIINTFYIAHCILSKFETSLIRHLPSDSLVHTDNCMLIFILFYYFPQLCSLPPWQSCNLAYTRQWIKTLENNSSEEI